MKNNLSIRSLRRLAKSAVAAALLTTGVFAQPSENANLTDDTYMVRLENNMTLLQENMKYQAPVESNLMISDELEQSMNMLASVTEQTLKYKAPASEETEISVSEINRSLAHQPGKAMVSRKTNANALYLTVGYHPEKAVKFSKKNNRKTISKNLAQKN
jgi:hypothetical protein